MKYILFLSVIFVFEFAENKILMAKPLGCSYAVSNRFGSGWCDLQAPLNLAKDSCISMQVGGTADTVLVRALRDGEDPSEAVGLLGKPRAVPGNREVILKVRRQYSNVIQISVHGGNKAWHIPLGNQNGPATLTFIEHIDCLKPN